MTKQFATFALVATIIANIFTSCLGGDDESDEVFDTTTLSGSTAVTSFNLKPNSKLLTNIDSVFFSIDLDKALIYNADSLPYGTKTTKLLVNIGTLTGATLEISVKDGTAAKDTTFTYTTSSTDSIDFTGKVTLKVTAMDGITSRNYDIKVNVHQVKPDSLMWNKTAMRSLPTNLDVTAQKTIEYAGKTMCLTTDGDKYSLATTEDIYSDEWTITSIEFGFTPDISTFEASNDAMYILDNLGNLYKSTDANIWSDCEVTWAYIYGGYEEKILGVTKSDDGSYFHAIYPEPSGYSAIAIDSKFPVSGTSALLTFNSEWSEEPQAMMLGGRLADGSLTGDAWAFDGNTWARISVSTPIPGIEGTSLIPYFTYKTGTDNWTYTRYSTLIAIGGKLSDGTLNNTVYTSIDRGFHWREADQMMQLPDYIPAMAYSQGVVSNTTLYGRSATSSWTEFSAGKVPLWWEIADSSMSRVSQLPTEWQCPYIYLFGGVNAEGTLYNSIWRGVINRLTFRPLF